MIIISDTTPLITLMKLNQLVLLKRLFKEIVIPNAVYDELTTSPEYQNEAKVIRDATFIKTAKVYSVEEVRSLMHDDNLDIGESEAIVLYKEKSASLLLMDERRGRKVAQSKGINVMGTTGLIVNSVYKGYLSAEECRECHAKLMKSNARIKDSILDALEDAAQGKYQERILAKTQGIQR